MRTDAHHAKGAFHALAVPAYLSIKITSAALLSTIERHVLLLTT